MEIAMQLEFVLLGDRNQIQDQCACRDTGHGNLCDRITIPTSVAAFLILMETFFQSHYWFICYDSIYGFTSTIIHAISYSFL